MHFHTHYSGEINKQSKFDGLPEAGNLVVERGTREALGRASLVAAAVANTHHPKGKLQSEFLRVIRSSMEPTILDLPFRGSRSGWKGPESEARSRDVIFPDHQIAPGPLGGGAGAGGSLAPSTQREAKNGGSGDGRVRQKKKSQIPNNTGLRFRDLVCNTIE